MPGKTLYEPSGNMSSIIFKGNTVLRDLKPQSKTIHRLLKHLEAKGFSYRIRL